MPRKNNQKRNSGHPCCSCLKCATGRWLLSLIFGIISIVVVWQTVPQIVMHIPQHHLSEKPNNVFQFGAGAIGSIYQRVGFDVYMVPPSGGLGPGMEFFDSTFQGYYPEFQPRERLDTDLDSLRVIYLVWYPHIGKAFVMHLKSEFFDTMPRRYRLRRGAYQTRDVIGTIDVLNVERLRVAGDLPYIEADFYDLEGRDKNLEQIRKFIATYVLAHSTEDEVQYLNQTVDTIYNRALTALDSIPSSRMPWRYSDTLALFLLLVSLCVGLLCFLWYRRAVPDVIRGWNNVQSARNQFREFVNQYGNCFTSPRSLYWEFFKDRSAGDFGDYHNSLLDSEVQAEKDRRAEDEAELQFHLLLREVEAEIATVFGDDLPLNIERQLNSCNKVRKPWTVRLFELNTARMLIHTRMASAQKTDDPVHNIQTYEETLWEQVGAIIISELPVQQARKFKQMIATARVRKRQSKRIYWLHLALSVALGEIVVDDAVSSSPNNDSLVELSNGNGGIVEADLSAMLNIDQYLPDDVDANCAAQILIGLVRPTKQVTSIGERYTKAIIIRRFVERKLDNFDSSRFDSALTWLISVGVVIQPKKNRKSSEALYSLNPHESDASEKGKKIIRKVFSFLREFKQLTT